MHRRVGASLFRDDWRARRSTRRYLVEARMIGARRSAKFLAFAAAFLLASWGAWSGVTQSVGAARERTEIRSAALDDILPHHRHSPLQP
jgi:hypothetical protein